VAEKASYNKLQVNKINKTKGDYNGYGQLIVEVEEEDNVNMIFSLLTSEI
jgi:hypothetical protein